MPLVAARTAAARPMNRGEGRDDAVGLTVEHEDERETDAVCGTVKAELPERRRAAATLVMEHFMIEIELTITFLANILW